MVNDVTNPPLASRFFSYAALAGYEVVSQHDLRYKSMHGILRDYPLQKPDTIQGYYYQLSGILAMLETAKKLQPSGSLLESYETHLLDSCHKAGISTKTIDQSKAYALQSAKKYLPMLRVIDITALQILENIPRLVAPEIGILRRQLLSRLLNLTSKPFAPLH